MLKALSLKLHPNPLRLLGDITAGFPNQAEEFLEDSITLDDYLINKPNSTFLWRVKGDSMIGAGIMEGDLILVERGSSPHVGDTILAEIDGQYTLKLLGHRKGKICLLACNPDYPTLFPKESLKISGIVVGIVRKLKY